MDVSVVIVNWNTRDLLRGALKSLVGTAACVSPGGSFVDSLSTDSSAGIPAPGVSTEVIVVDNASTDGSAQMTAAEFPAARLIGSGVNLGWAEGNNVGIRAGTGRYLFLLNPDTVVLEGAMEAMVRFMDAHSGAGACAPKLLNPDGTVQRSLRRFPEPMSLFWEVVGASKLFPRSRRFAAYRMGDFDYERPAEVEQPMGAALFIRREALDAVGLMDVAFPIFFNDVDWCYRAVKAGWRIHYVPDAVVTHFGGSSTSQVRPQMLAESHRGLERFYRKHYHDRLSPAVMAGVFGMSRAVERLRLARAGLRAGA